MDEKEVKSRLKSARENIQNKNYNDALKICEGILQANPSNYHALVFAGRCLVELENPTAAREFYGRATTVDESQILAWQGLLQLYEKYCIWDDNCVTCLRHLIKLTSDEKKKRDYQLQLAITLAKAGRLDESGNEFLPLPLFDDDNKEIEESVITHLGEANFKDEKVLDLVQKCFIHCIEKEKDKKKIALKTKLIHLLVQNYRYAEAYDVSVSIQPHEMEEPDCGDYISDVAEIYCERYIRGTLNDSDEKTLEKLDGLFQEDTPKLGNAPKAATTIAALVDAIGHDWVEVKESLESEIKTLKSPFLWFLLAKAKLHLHDCFGAIETAIEAQRGFHDGRLAMYRLKAAIIEAKAHLDIGSTSSLKKAITICDKITSQLDQAKFNNDDIDSDAKSTKAMAHGLQGSFDSAVATLQTVPIHTTVDYYLSEASVYLQFGKFAECREAVDNLQQFTDDLENEDKAKLHYIRGRLLWDTNENKSNAFKEFLESAKLDANYADSFYYMGRCYEDLNLNEKALKVYDRAYSLAGRYKWNYGQSLSDCYRKLGDHEKNLALLLEITNSHPVEHCTWAWLRLGLEYLSESKADDAVRVLQTVLRIVDTDIRCWECLGEAYAIRGSYASALKAFEKVIELESDIQKLLYAKYRTAMVNLVMRRYDDAANGFKEVLKLEPDHLPSLVGLGRARVELTKFYFNAARYQRSLDVCVEAISTLSQMVVEKPRCTSGWYLLGAALTLLNQYPDSELEKSILPDFGTLFKDDGIVGKLDYVQLGSRCYAQAISLNSNVAQIWHDLGVNLFVQAKRKNHGENSIHELLLHAMNCLKHAVQLDPMKPRFWLTLASVATSELVDQPELAQHCFIKSLSAEPHQAAAWTGLGVLYKKYDELNLANRCFERAQSIDPDYSTCWVGQAMLAEEVAPSEALDLFRHSVELGNNVQALAGYGYHVLQTILDPSADTSSSQYQYAIDHLHAIPVAQVALQKYCWIVPKDPCALNMLALLLEQEKMWTSSSSTYLRALDTLKAADQNAADMDEIVAGNACSVFGKLGNNSMMRKLAGKMTTKNTFENLCMRGLAYYRLGQLDKSLELYSEAVYASNSGADQVAVNFAFGLIAAKQADWKKHNELLKQEEANEYAPMVFWSTICGLLETGELDMDNIRIGFSRLRESPGGCEWQKFLAAVCCLYIEKFSSTNAQWLLHSMPYDVNLWRTFKRTRRKSGVEWIGSLPESTIIPSLERLQAIEQMEASSKKEKIYSIIRHQYNDMQF